MRDDLIVQEIIDQLHLPTEREVLQFPHDPSWEGQANGQQAEFALFVTDDEIFQVIYDPYRTGNSDFRWSALYYPDRSTIVSVHDGLWVPITEEQFREVLLNPTPPRHLFPRWPQEGCSNRSNR